MSPTPTLPDRLRGGDATALLELAHATHPRALAVARASSWGRDPESLLLDAYVALWLRRADAPASGAEAWALAEVLAYCARRAAGGAGTRAARAQAERHAVRHAVREAVRRVRQATAGAAGVVARMVARMAPRASTQLAPPPVGRPSRSAT